MKNHKVFLRIIADWRDHTDIVQPRPWPCSLTYPSLSISVIKWRKLVVFFNWSPKKLLILSLISSKSMILITYLIKINGLLHTMVVWSVGKNQRFFGLILGILEKLVDVGGNSTRNLPCFKHILFCTQFCQNTKKIIKSATWKSKVATKMTRFSSHKQTIPVSQALGIRTANWCSQSLPINKASFSRDDDLDLRFGWSKGHVLNYLERFLWFFSF